MWLPVLWSGVINAYGRIKGNRVGQSIWDGGIDADLVIYMNGLITELSESQILNLNTLVKAWKTHLGIENLSEAFDHLVIWANETSEAALRNLTERDHDGTLAGSTVPAFTALEGFRGDGTVGYVNLDFNLADDGVRFTRNSCSWGVYIRTNLAAATDIDYGVKDGAYENFLMARTGGDTAYYSLNSADSQLVTGITDSRGMWIGTRADANSPVLYRNKVSLNSTAKASVSPTSRIAYGGGRNNAGNLDFAAARQISLIFHGKYFTPTEVGYITDDFEAYMDANSKGVI